MSADYFKKLFESKFGTQRGSQLRGAEALGVRQGNLSQYIRGANKPPKKYIDALLAMPDHKVESGISYELAGGVNQLVTRLSFKLTSRAAKYLDVLTRLETRDFKTPDLNADEDVTALFFEKLFVTCYLAKRKENSQALYAALDAIQRDKDEERAELRKELNERKHLVADELTENEIFEDAGGVSMSEDHADEDPLT